MSLIFLGGTQLSCNVSVLLIPNSHKESSFLWQAEAPKKVLGSTFFLRVFVHNAEFLLQSQTNTFVSFPDNSSKCENMQKISLFPNRSRKSCSFCLEKLFTLQWLSAVLLLALSCLSVDIKAKRSALYWLSKLCPVEVLHLWMRFVWRSITDMKFFRREFTAGKDTYLLHTRYFMSKLQTSMISFLLKTKHLKRKQS